LDEENRMRNVKVLRATVGLLLVVVLAETALFGYREVVHRTAPVIVKQVIEEKQDKVIAQIGDVQIKQSELINDLYATNGAELLNQILDREAIRMKAEEIGLKLTREDINQELKRMQQGYDSEALFYKSMKEQVGMTEAELREDVNYKLLLEGIATKDIVVSDEEIKTYMDEHKEEFKNTMQMHIEQIEVDTIDDARKVAELIKKGNDFETVAKTNSTDTATANDGGDLGWVEEDDPFIAVPIMKAVKSLSIGEISEPIAVDNKYYIIRLLDHKENSKGTPEEIKASLHKQLALQKALPLKDLTKLLREKKNATILDSQLK
jgi:foldase protein PrsA